MADARFLLDESSQTFLSEREKEQCRKFNSAKRRQDWLAGRWAVKRLIQRQSGDEISPDSIEVFNRDSGEPYIESPQLPSASCPSVSISHCSRYALAAAAGPGTRIGADIETIASREPSWLGLVAHPSENFPGLRDDPAKQTVLWSLKEAVVKVLGTGLSVGFEDVRLIPDERGTQVPALGRVRIELHGQARHAWAALGRPELSFESTIFNGCALSMIQAPLQEKNINGIHLND